MSLLTRTPMALEIDRRDLPNRVTTSFTPVGNEADLTLTGMTTGLPDHLVRLEQERRGDRDPQGLAQTQQACHQGQQA
jgi:hypothetical protein